jgi:DNA replication and repair protein RecF
MRSLAVEALAIRGFRNLTSVDVAFGSGFNVVGGDNGQGKTNLLESVYVVATSRSFRTAKLGDFVQVGGDAASIRATIREDDEVREQTVGLRPGQRLVRADGKRPGCLALYAVQTPVVVFHPAGVALSAGPGRERRKLLDRIALYVSASSLSETAAYGRAMQARQRLLETRRESPQGIEQWEELAVKHGGALSRARREAATRLSPAVEKVFGRIGPSGLALHIRYEPNAPEDPDAFRAALVASRPRDRARGSASVGPHRDDLALQLGGHPVRGMASQGQHRAVVLALELAEMEVVQQARGVRPILLLDDVSSELDRERTAALVASLRDQRGQVILTTTRPEFIDIGAGSGVDKRRDFAVVRGQIRVV